ncbi:right-handed parallel beta-helix repeat-containing protein, partial [Candidatus Woesearchaeota archaeon]|nr:right-handed parallel beta-helix repeat-containing protein [Candidatus Woesearchaeota archaeon]
MKKRGNRDKYAIAGLFIVPILLLALFFFNHQEELAFLSSAKSYLTGAVVSDGSGELPSGIIRVLDAEANSTSCGYVNTNITLTAGIVNSTGTCFTINISNLVLDCAGSTILYGQDVFGWGVNNTGFNNITVKNCLIFTGSAIDTSNYGLYFTNGVNSTIRNNSIKTNGSGSSDYGIYLLKYNYTTMELNTIQTNGTSSNHGIYLSDGLNSTLRNNTITTNGTSSSNYGMYLLRYNDSLIANSTISSYSSGGYGVYLSASGTNTLRSNNITTRTSILNSQSRGILIDGKNSFNLIINNTILADCQNCHTIAISGGNNNTVRENTILTAQSNGNDHGIDITGGSKHVVDGNTMNIGGSDTGMYLAASTSLEVRNNLFPLISTVYNDFGIRLVATNDSTFNNNTFASESRWGFTFDSNSSNNTFSSNAILLNDSTGENYGFWLNQGSNNLFINNNITVGSQGTTIDTSGFRLDGTSKDNIFINNIVSLSSSHVSIYDTTANVQNALIYNNSFGQINW